MKDNYLGSSSPFCFELNMEVRLGLGFWVQRIMGKGYACG